METLLQKAKVLQLSGKNKQISGEQVEVAVAWAKGEITYSQAQSVLSASKTISVYPQLARALKIYLLKEKDLAESK